MDELATVVEMGHHFVRSTGYADLVHDDPSCMEELGKRLIRNGTLLVSEEDGRLTGMLGFLIYSHFISGQQMAVEAFWWVEPGHRGAGIRLLREMEKRARQAGAKNVQMIAPNDKVAHFYELVGYKFVESTYQLTL